MSARPAAKGHEYTVAVTRLLAAPRERGTGGLLDALEKSLGGTP